MSDVPAMEACRTPEALRAAYAGAVAKEVAAGPESLAVLRARFRKRRRELSQGLGTTIEGRAAWILACLESSLPDEYLEAELLRLHTEDPKLDLARLRQILDAREEWKEARRDPDVPPVVLHVLLRRLGVPPRARAMAQDVAYPRQVAERVESAYPRVHALDARMFRSIAGVPTSANRGLGPPESGLPAKKKSRRSFWLIVLAIWAVAQLLSLAGRALKQGRVDDNAPPRVERSEFGAEHDRVVRRLKEVRALESELRVVQDALRSTLAITTVRRQRLRERIQDIRVSVTELLFPITQVQADTGYPRLADVPGLLSACQAAANRLDLQRMQLRLEAERRVPGARGGRR